MKRMSELKDNLQGVKCCATKEAFRYLVEQKRKPYIDLSPTVAMIRVQIDGHRYDYVPVTGKWSPTKNRGHHGTWRISATVEDFYKTAVNMSAGIYPPTQKQLDFLAELEMQTGQKADEDARTVARTCSDEIDRLRKLVDCSTYLLLGEEYFECEDVWAFREVTRGSRRQCEDAIHESMANPEKAYKSFIIAKKQNNYIRVSDDENF